MQTWVKVCLALLVAVPVRAQDVPPPASAVVPVVVRDHKGAPVEGLAKDNFTIKVDGAVQPLTAAQAGAAEHVTYGLLIDVSPGQHGVIEGERRAARTLVEALRPGDRMFVVHFARDIELLQAPTADKAKLEAALNQVGTASASFHISDPKGGSVDEEGRRIQAGGTSLNDALFLSADEVLAKDPDRHVLVVISDGVDVGSKESMTDTVDALERANAVVYTMYSRNVDTFGERQRGRSGSGGTGGNRPSGGSWPGGGYPGSYPGSYPGGGGGGTGGTQPSSNPNPNDRDSDPAHKPNVDGRGVLAKLSSETGGRLFEAGRHGMEGDFSEIVEDVRSTYWLSFTPQGPAARHGYHTFDLLVNGPDKSRKVDVRTSDGYYTGG